MVEAEELTIIPFVVSLYDGDYMVELLRVKTRTKDLALLGVHLFYFGLFGGWHVSFELAGFVKTWSLAKKEANDA